MIDYETVISYLEEKQRLVNKQFDAAISAIRQIAAFDQQPLIPSGSTVHPPKVAMKPWLQPEGPAKPYHGMSIIDAAKAHLHSIGRPVPNVDLARALEEGGVKHKSKSFTNTLNSVLRRRSEKVGDVKKVGRAWVLAVRPDD